MQHKRLHECDAQIAALRRGLCTGIPSQLLQLWTANECALRVAGDPDIEVADLKKQTRFRRVAGGSAAAGRQREVEAMFWQCVERMSMSERSLLLKFAAGRLRLPCPLEIIIEGETDRHPTGQPQHDEREHTALVREDPEAGVRCVGCVCGLCVCSMCRRETTCSVCGAVLYW